MMAFPGNPGKLEERLLQVALSAERPLIKNAGKPLAVRAGFYAINEYLQHCLVIFLEPVNWCVSQVSVTITKHPS